MTQHISYCVPGLESPLCGGGRRMAKLLFRLMYVIVHLSPADWIQLTGKVMVRRWRNKKVECKQPTWEQGIKIATMTSEDFVSSTRRMLCWLLERALIRFIKTEYLTTEWLSSSSSSWLPRLKMMLKKWNFVYLSKLQWNLIIICWPID